MISCRSMFRIVLVTFVVGMLAACVKQDSADYCNNHDLYHESHAENVGVLNISHSEDGRVVVKFSLPKSLIGRRSESAGRSLVQIIELLSDQDKVFKLQSETDCTVDVAVVRSADAGILASYGMDCGADTRIGQIDIPLFDVLPEIDEVEVEITTPATTKHFAISRQCDNAIFRLQTRRDD